MYVLSPHAHRKREELDYWSFFQQDPHTLLCCAESPSHVQLFATPWTVTHQAPLTIGILQGTILEWVAMSSSRGLSQPRDQTQVTPTLQADSLLSETTGKPKNTRVGSLTLLWGIFPTQELNLGLLHCRQILYQLSN